MVKLMEKRLPSTVSCRFCKQQMVARYKIAEPFSETDHFDKFLSRECNFCGRLETIFGETIKEGNMRMYLLNFERR